MQERTNCIWLLLVVLCVILTSCGKNPKPLESPDAPDFKIPISYTGWLRKQLEFPSEDNARASYSCFFQKPNHSVTAFLAPLVPAVAKQLDDLVSNGRPWEPTEFEDLDNYLKDIKRYVGAYEEGSRYRYFSVPLEIDAGNTLFIKLPHLGNSRFLSKAVIALAWRKQDNFDSDAFAEKVMTVFRHANHINQGLSLVEKRVSIGEKDIAYDAILTALNKKLPPYSSLTKVKDYLIQNDSNDMRKILSQCIVFEQACSFALLQEMCRPFPHLRAPRLNKKKVYHWYKLFAGGDVAPNSKALLQKVLKEDPVTLADAIRSYYDESLEMLRGGSIPDCTSAFDELPKKYKSKHSYFQAFPLTSFSTSYREGVQTERKRRLTHLALALLEYHHKNKVFPENLSVFADADNRLPISDSITNTLFQYWSHVTEARIGCLEFGAFSHITVHLEARSEH